MSSSESPKINGESNRYSPTLNASSPSSSGDVKKRGGWPKGKKRSKPATATSPSNKRSKKSQKKQTNSAAQLNNEDSRSSGVSSSNSMDIPIFRDEKMMGQAEFLHQLGCGRSKTAHHGRNSMPIANGEEEVEECHDWWKQMSVRQINDFVDLNDGEKAIMNMWNGHLQLNPISGKRMLIQCLEDFIRQHGLKIYRQNLYKNLVLHLSNLHDFRLISSSTVMNMITKYQTLVEETIENPEKYPITPPKMPIKNPYYKPEPVPFESLNSTSNLSDTSSEMISSVVQEIPSVGDFVEDFNSSLQDGEGAWNCSICTYTNAANNYKCAMCHNNTSNRKSTRKSRLTQEKMTADGDKIPPIKTSAFYGKMDSSPAAAFGQRRRHASSGQIEVQSLHDGLSHIYTHGDSRLRHKSANSSVSDLANSFDSKVSIQTLPKKKSPLPASKSTITKLKSQLGIKDFTIKLEKLDLPSKALAQAQPQVVTYELNPSFIFEEPPKIESNEQKSIRLEKEKDDDDCDNDEAGSANEEAEAPYECGGAAPDCSH